MPERTPQLASIQSESDRYSIEKETLASDNVVVLILTNAYIHYCEHYCTEHSEAAIESGFQILKKSHNYVH